MRATWSGASCCRAGPSASGAIRRCCAASAAPAWPTCARRPSPRTRASSRGSCRRGRTSTRIARRGRGRTGCGRHWCRSRASRSRPRSGSATCCPGGWAPTAPAGSTSSPPAARWSGSAPARWARAAARSPSISARTSASPARRPATRSSSHPEGEVHDEIRALLEARPCFWLDLIADIDRSPEELHEALWDLAWAGEATNDAFAPLRAPRLSAVRNQQRRGRRFAARRAATGQAVQGRWSLTELDLRRAALERARACAPRRS